MGGRSFSGARISASPGEGLRVSAGFVTFWPGKQRFHASHNPKEQLRIATSQVSNTARRGAPGRSLTDNIQTAFAYLSRWRRSHAPTASDISRAVKARHI